MLVSSGPDCVLDVSAVFGPFYDAFVAICEGNVSTPLPAVESVQPVASRVLGGSWVYGVASLFLVFLSLMETGGGRCSRTQDFFFSSVLRLKNEP